jgi:prepilin-type N-terminal cleavage/methylation domain-containing protein/prepilin-type processing-associated H-X9-DG protein
MKLHNKITNNGLLIRSRAAFTLVELLAVIAIVGILAAIVIPTVAAARSHAAKAVEISAARQLMVGYHLAATENRGWLMPAKAQSANGAVVGESGEALSAMINIRWPHRMRPYLGDRFKKTLYVNKQEPLYDLIASNGQGDLAKNYALSLATTFGMNGWFVGSPAYSESLADATSDAPVAKISQAPNPGRLLAFASATNRVYGDDYGYFVVKPPSLWSNPHDLSGFPDDASADPQYGFVAFRHGGKAVTAFLDGSVALMGSRELRDMRHWSPGAQERNDAAYLPPSFAY